MAATAAGWLTAACCQALLGALFVTLALLMVLLRHLFGGKSVYLLDLHCFQPPER